MIGLVKTAMRKTIGNAYLTFDELKEVFLDVEIALNGRPLSDFSRKKASQTAKLVIRQRPLSNKGLVSNKRSP